MTVAYSGYGSAALSQSLWAEAAYSKRPTWMPLLYLVPLMLTGVSWVAGGVPNLTDLGFVVLVILGFVFLAIEFISFPRRFGIGGLLIFGGYLTWWCHDYFNNWYGWGFTDYDAPFPKAVIAKAAYFHVMFLISALCGLLLPMGKPYRVLHLVPEPRTPSLYFGIIIIAFMIGVSPYFLFTAEPWYIAIYNSMIAARGAGGARWTIGSSGGRLNYNFGAYIAQLMQMGQVGGQFAVFYALLISRSTAQKVFCWLVWIFWVLICFGTGTRGIVAFMVLPVLALVFLKFQSDAASNQLKKAKIAQAYLAGGIVLFVLVVLVQIQGQYRTIGYRDVDFSEINVLKLQGNSMFTEGLPGWRAVPDQTPFFSNNWPGEGLIRPIPETAFWFVVKFIPRALWNSKPLDPMEEWYYDAASGGNFQATISTGLVGEWYFRYGWMGVVQGGLLFGWLARMAEKGLQTAEGRPMVILLSLGLTTWLFRTYRNFMFHDLYPLIVGAICIYGLVRLTEYTSGQPAPRSNNT
ncbi:MAG: hypothetical protein K8S99_04760 [Planctomycetes bacterium]|nr:hypothetical protein [Planctomycetota bacterium]